MAVGDSVNYLLFGNPLSQGLLSGLSSVAKSAGIVSKSQVANKTTSATSKMVASNLPLWKLSGVHHNFVRFAGLSGATAVILGAVGSHTIDPHGKGEERTIFETANRFHFFHSIALMAVPMARQPIVTGTLMALGTVLFSGTLYYRAFTGERKFSKAAPIGGFCLIVAWLTLLF